jgi:hypothetical protein
MKNWITFSILTTLFKSVKWQAFDSIILVLILPMWILSCKSFCSNVCCSILSRWININDWDLTKNNNRKKNIADWNKTIRRAFFNLYLLERLQNYRNQNNNLEKIIRWTISKYWQEGYFSDMIDIEVNPNKAHSLDFVGRTMIYQLAKLSLFCDSIGFYETK